MRVGILIDRIQAGGVEKIAIQQTRSLLRLGIDAELVVLRRSTPNPDAFIELRSELPTVYLDDRFPRWMRVSFPVPFFYFFSTFHITYALLLPWFVKSEEYDFLVSHNSYTSFAALGLYKAKGIPFIMHVWDPTSYILEKVYRTGALRLLRPVLLPL